MMPLFDDATTTTTAADVAVSEEPTTLIDGVASAAEAETAAAAPAVDHAAQIADLQRQVTELTARASVPSAAAPFDHRQLASALVEAENARQAEFARLQAHRADLQPPAFSEDEKAALIADPDALLRAVQRIAMHGAKTVLAQVAPDLRKARVAFELSGPHSDAVADLAYNRARDFATNAGIPSEEYDSLGQTAYDYMWQAAQQSEDPHMHFAKMTQNPQAIYTAVTMARTQRGGGPAIADKRPVAPTVGAGSHREASPQPRVPNALLAKVEEHLGRKPTAADLKRLQDTAKSYTQAFPSI